MARQVRFIAYSALVVGCLFLVLPLLTLLPQPHLPGFYSPSGPTHANRSGGVILILLALPPLITFAGLRRFRPWGRTLAMVLAVVGFVVPVSWYVLWVLTRPAAKELFGVGSSARAAGFKRFAIVAGWVIAAPFVIAANISLLVIITRDVAHPHNQVSPIRDILTGEGSDNGYCGMDASGKLLPNLQTVRIRGVVLRHPDDRSRTYLLVDGPSNLDDVVVTVNREFPVPANREKIEVLGVVQCFESPHARFVAEAARYPWKVPPDDEKPVSAKAGMADLTMWLLIYRHDTGSFPTSAQGIAALRERPAGVTGWHGPYGLPEIELDPWGHKYGYRYPSERGDLYPDLICFGADGRPGGDGLDRDIVSWRSR